MTEHAEYPRAARATSGKAVIALALAIASLLVATMPLLSISAAVAGVVIALLARGDLKERLELDRGSGPSGQPSLSGQPELAGFGLSLAAFIVAGAVLAWAALMYVLPMVLSTLILL